MHAHTQLKGFGKSISVNYMQSHWDHNKFNVNILFSKNTLFCINNLDINEIRLRIA